MELLCLGLVCVGSCVSWVCFCGFLCIWGLFVQIPSVLGPSVCKPLWMPELCSFCVSGLCVDSSCIWGLFGQVPSVLGPCEVSLFVPELCVGFLCLGLVCVGSCVSWACMDSSLLGLACVDSLCV